MPYKKMLAFLLVAVTVLLCGCSKKSYNEPNGNDTPENEEQPGTRSITLFYCQADSFNPYTCSTKYNKDLCDLLYEPLIKLDENYNIVTRLAANYDASPDSVSVSLMPAMFSNGASFNAYDVLYSFNLAKSHPKYSSCFSSVNCAVVGGQIVFSLASPDLNFVNMLDFPIIQADSDKIKSTDNILLPPVGCGRYVLSNDKTSLEANKKYYAGNVNIKHINLINVPDSVSAEHYLEVGDVDYYYSDLSDDTVPRLNGKSTTSALNNLVYIGVNQKNPVLKSAALRRAVSAALNRAALVNNAFHSNAVAAKSPFNPLWNEVKDYNYIDEKENLDVAVANLEEIGYNSKDRDGYYVNSAGQRLSLSMLCPTSDKQRIAAADMIAAQLARIGIQITVDAVSFDQFALRLKTGNFQLFLSEIKIGQNMDISSFVVPGGKSAYGIVEYGSHETDSPENEDDEHKTKLLSTAISQYKKGSAPIFDIISVFNENMPVIPICFKCGISICASDFEISPHATVSDVFYNIEKATFK